MVLVGVDHTTTPPVVAVEQPAGSSIRGPCRHAWHGELVSWARTRWPGPAQRIWAVEDCRHVPGRRERDLLAAWERLVRVPPRLMAGARQPCRPRASPTVRMWPVRMCGEATRMV